MSFQGLLGVTDDVFQSAYLPLQFLGFGALLLAAIEPHAQQFGHTSDARFTAFAALLHALTPSAVFLYRAAEKG